MNKRINLKRKVREKIFIYAVLAYPILNFLIFYGVVNINSFLLAFQKYDINMNVTFVGFENFVTVIREIVGEGGLLGLSLRNSLLIFIFTFVLGFPLNMLFSYYIFKKKFLSGTLRFLMYIPSIISSMIMSLVFLKFTEIALPNLLKNWGLELPVLLNNESTALGTIIFYMIWTGFASNMILYPNAMNAIGTEVLESARLDGATELQELIKIIIPSIFPTITTFVVTSVAVLFTQTGPLYAFYGYNAPGHVYNTGYYLFVRTMSSEGQTSYPFAAASGLILTVVSVPITLFVRWLMEKIDPTEE